VKTELVLRLLGGETIAALSRETGKPRRQLSAWRRRFLAGGEASLESRFRPGEVEALRSERDELSKRVAELENEKRSLSRRTVVLDQARSNGGFSHPYCSEAYFQASGETGAKSLRVPDWGTHVLVREGLGGKRPAVGARPFASLHPAADLEAGLVYLREAGITSVSLASDPMWGPEASDLQQAFDVCRKFKEIYLVDKASEKIEVTKRHRNRINQARSSAKLREISLADHLDTWLELYKYNVANRQIPQPFSDAYFERLAELPNLRTNAVLVGGEIVTITIWIPYQDTLYFHDAASNERGHAASASYVAFADVVENTDDCRYLFLGGSAEFYDDPLDGLARFKRGFANRSDLSYLCSSILSPPTSATPA
jgi:transposase-like protein